MCLWSFQDFQDFGFPQIGEPTFFGNVDMEPQIASSNSSGLWVLW